MQNNPKNILVQALHEAIQNTYANLSLAEVSASVAYCDPKFGQFSTNLVFRISRAESAPAQQVAEHIIEALSQDKSVESAEFVQPGFINIQMSNQVWVEFAESINDNFLESKPSKDTSIQLEFISANPTGPLVLTNAWQGYYGDILANIYTSQGFKTSTEYLLNDGGNQIIALGKAIQQALGKDFEAEVTEDLYRGEYVDEVAGIVAKEYGSKEEIMSAEPLKIGTRAAEIIVEDYIKPDLAQLGVNFDSMFSESRLDIKKTLTRLEDAGLIKHKEGAIWIDGQKVGLDKDQVLIRSYDKGESYFVKDIAYQLERLEERGFGQTITVVGPDHHGQAIRLVNTLKVLGHDSFKEISTQTIRLIKDGKEFKMSKRKGNYILLKDFLEMVPTEAARFYFAMRDTNTHMDFDVDLVKEHSAKNPVYYSLYAYARACSIISKADGVVTREQAGLDGYELSLKEKKLLLEISKLPEILYEITQNQRVHLLLHQTYEVAKAFHEYYESERVLDSEHISEKLYFINQFRAAYQAIFRIIGVSLLEKM